MTIWYFYLAKIIGEHLARDPHADAKEGTVCGMISRQCAHLLRCVNCVTSACFRTFATVDYVQLETRGCTHA